MSGKKTLWTNQDGLVVGFGPREETSSSAAKVSSGGYRQQLVLKIKGTDLTDVVSASSDAIVHGAIIPADSLIESAKLFVTTAFAGTNAALDIGVFQVDGTIVDDDGVDAAIAVGSLTDNVVITANGADIGTIAATDVKIAASYDTAAFTAGEATLVVEYVTEAP